MNRQNSIANKFGGGIEFREGVPIQLLNYSGGKFGKIILNPEALNILQTITEPLAIISVVGSFRRGKSYFANVLHGRHDGFELGAKVDACTHGIYMWSPPFKLESKQSDGTTIQKRVIVLDSEGIDDPKQDQNWSTKLFILCLVISSTFIYNINGIVGNNDIGKLYLMTDLSKFIQEPEVGDFLPRLVILLRDFDLETPKNFKDYFMEKLRDVDLEAAKAIGRFFYDFDVYGLPHPGCKRKTLQHMEVAETDQLDTYFVNNVENVVKEIYSQLPLKYIGSSTMKGTAFVKFLQDIVECMNSSKTSTLLSIPSEYESIIQFIAQEALKEAIERYKERMNILMNDEGKLPMLWEEFEGMHDECISKVNKLFFKKIIGGPLQIGNFVEQLNEQISIIKGEFMKRNSKELMIYNENIAKKFWERCVKIGLNSDNSFKSTEEFQKALKSFESAYDESMKKSPEAAKVFALYRQNQYPTAINYMTQLGRINTELAKVMHDKDKAERLRLEALARVEEICMEIEVQKRERQEREKNFRVKMLELQTNIEQQKKSNEEMKRRLIEEKELSIKKYNQKLAEMQKENLESRMKIIEEQQRKFEQMRRSIEEECRKENDELRNKLFVEKEKDLGNQNEFYQKIIFDQIKATQRQTDAVLEHMRRENEYLKNKINNMEYNNNDLIPASLSIIASVITIVPTLAALLL